MTLLLITLTGCKQTSTEDSLYFVHQDHLNVPAVLTDKDKKVVWEGHREPFGKTEVTVATIQQPFRFPGQYYDAETGLSYNLMRDYDPATGRYVQSDPIGLAGGINTYAYVNGNPIMFIDPLGLWSASIEGYLGIGGGVNVSYSNGTLEIISKIGVGYGGGVGFDPLGLPSPHSESCGSGFIARTSTNISAEFGAGPLKLGGQASVVTGNAVTTPVGGDYFSSSWSNVNASDKLIGGGLGANYSVEFGSYTNW